MKEISAQNISHIDALIKKYDNDCFQDIYESYNAARRDLINPYFLSDEEYVQKWLDIPYGGNPSHPEHLQFKTENGIMVRSKSEQIIAENLFRLGIPYKYEAPVPFAPGLSLYPDFTVLNVRRRKVIYYEHFGRMAEDGYRDDFFWKMSIYTSLGIFIGKDLICTFEDLKHPFDFSSHRKMYEELFWE